MTERLTVVHPDTATARDGDADAGRDAQHVTTAVLAVVVVLLVVVEWSLLRDSGNWDVLQLLYWESLIVLYCVSGLLANWRQPHNPFGLLMFWAGLTLWCAGLQLAANPALALIGDIMQTMPIAAVAHLVMAYPYGRLPDRLSRIVVVSIYTVALALQAPSYVLAGNGALMIADLPAVAAAVSSAQRVVGVLGLFVAAGVVLRRLRLDRPERRHRMGPLVWYGPIALLALIAASTIIGTFGRIPVVGVLQSAVLLGLPILFLAGLLTGSFGRAGELREFLARVGGDRLQPSDLDGAVARALGDPSARILYGPGASAGYFAADGSPVDVHRQDVVPIHYDGEVVGAIVYSADSVIDDRLLQAVARICALPADHQRVVAVLRAALLDLKESATALRQTQFRLVQASDTERRRIARDLHDGVQQRIVVLGLQVRSLTRHADDPASVRGTAVTLQQGMSDLLDDFRTLVHGIMPASLADRGIESAIRDLGERTAVPLVLRSSGLGRRLPQAIESTVYFVVLESVTNAVKHAAASGIWVELVQVDGLLCAAVRDDGHGGAALGGGSGLEGLRDRVLALNGSLTVSSAPGTGTEVKALIPCG
jgi:signal transduction histidine kinase